MENILLTKEKTPELRFATLSPETWMALNDLPRTGWVNRGVKNPESVAEHIVSLRDLAFSFSDLPEIKMGDLLDMLEVHDWPEAIHGDQVILTNDEKERRSLKMIKFEKERQALSVICSKLGEKGDSIMSLWLRFETSQDETALFARQLDKYQAVEKALEYERIQNIPLFKEFLDYSRKSIKHPAILKKLEEMEANWTPLS